MHLLMQKMDLTWTLSGICLLLQGVTVVLAQSDCPDEFWDGPTKACLAKIDSVLDEIVQGEWQMADVRINKTCKGYDEMKTCMEDLFSRCSEDEEGVQDLRRVIDRYQPYILPCNDEKLRYRQRLVDCFHTHIPPTRQCVNDFDDKFQAHILKDDFDNACRDIETVVECFDSTKKKIMRKCKEEGAQEFYLDYILPIIEPTRETVVTKCPKLKSPYREYYGMSSGTSRITDATLISGIMMICAQLATVH